MRDIFTLLKDHFGDRRIDGVEIGSREGKFARKLMLQCPKAVLWCVDPWRKLEGDIGSSDEAWRSWRTKLRQWYGVRVFAYKALSWEAAPKFENAGFDFVFIDGDHRAASVTRDLKDWSTKVKKGGLVIGHDWDSDRWGSDIQAGVTEWLSTRQNKLKIETDVTYMGVRCFYFVA